MIFGNPSVIVQNMLCKTPKSLNAVDMVLAAVRKRLAVIQAMVLAPALQGIVTAEGVGVIDRSFSGMLLDMGHEFISRYPFHNLGVYPAITLQKAKYNAFPGSAPSPLAFPSATKVGFVNLDFSFEFPCLKLGDMIDRFTQALVDAGNHLIIKAQVACHTIRRLLLVEAGDNAISLRNRFKDFCFPHFLRRHFT